MSKREPTTEQLAELAKYAAWAGRTWKRELVGDWMRAGSDFPGDYHLQHQLRNQQGPSWLNRYRRPVKGYDTTYISIPGVFE